MISLSCLDAFVRSARSGSFSAAARDLGLTAAAVSKNVAKLEDDLGVRLFHRSTRRLALTESGAVFLREAGGGLASIKSAVDALASLNDEPAGTLRVAMPAGWGLRYVLPALGSFLHAHPRVDGDWHTTMRPVDLIGEGFDAAIGGGFELASGVIARELSRIHIIAVASKRYLRGRPAIATLEDLSVHDGIAMRSGDDQRPLVFGLPLRPRVVVADPEAATAGALEHLGIALVPVGYTLDAVASGALVRVLPRWHMDFGPVSIYYASAKHLPAKTRAFIDHLLAHFKREKLAARFSA